MDPKQLREEVIRPSLGAIGLWSPGAEQLLFVTACVESAAGYFVKQVNGPALGIYQMEPATHDDLWENYLYDRSMREEGLTPWRSADERLVLDLEYSTQMARYQYYRFPEAIPEAHDMEGMWSIYKKRWNTHLGKTTFSAFQGAWNRYNANDYIVV